MDVPLLQTDRLCLRALCEDDLDIYAGMCGDTEVMRYMGKGTPLDREDSWRRIAMLIGHWHLCGFGMWAVVIKSTDRFIGTVGFHRPEGWPGFEMGWMIDRSVWRQGFATEAAGEVLRQAVPRYGQPHVISMILPGNIASIRVAERLGETLEAEIEFKGMHVLKYGIHLSE
jgi:RimJ/RimL family protein N-acetyltransferase